MNYLAVIVAFYRRVGVSDRRTDDSGATVLLYLEILYVITISRLRDSGMYPERISLPAIS
jgi:hypothetical protein